MFRINMYKVYVGLIAIILLTSQAQATRLFSYFFCCNKKEPIHDMKSLIIDQSLLRQVPQKAKLPKERVVEKLTLPELFIAPTGETLKLLDEIQKRDNYKLVPICAQQFALKRSVMAFKEFNDQIDRKILKYQFNRMNEHGRAILHGTQALVGHRAVVLKFEQMMGQKSQPEPQSTQQVMQQSIEQLIPEVNGLLDRLHGLYKKCSDSDTYLHDDDNELNKILDELICIFTTAKQQNHIFSTSNLRVFVEKLNELAYFNFCYDLQKVTTLYAAIVQHIKPYYSVKHAEKLVA